MTQYSNGGGTTTAPFTPGTWYEAMKVATTNKTEIDLEVVDLAIYAIEHFADDYDYVSIVDTFQLDWQPTTLETYCSIMRKWCFPSLRPDYGEDYKLPLSAYQAVNFKTLSLQQQHDLLVEFVEAQADGYYADTDDPNSIIPATIRNLKRRAAHMAGHNSNDEPDGDPSTPPNVYSGPVETGISYTKATFVWRSVYPTLPIPDEWAQGDTFTLQIIASRKERT